MLQPGIESSLAIVAISAMFVAVGLLFLFVNLLVGRLVRPQNPTPEKEEVYECGEPAIGSSFVQFDLRFYVVALLFIIFDVEVAFFFPWATLYGKVTNLSQAPADQVAFVDPTPVDPTPVDPTLDTPALDNRIPDIVLGPTSVGIYRELGYRDLPTNENGFVVAPTELSASMKDIKGSSREERAQQIVKQGALQLAWFTLIDIAVFFAVLLVGFAYVWKRGDLDWVRAVSLERAQRGDADRDSSDPVNEQLVSV
jgi:NADH-quinone oxidoreductase subunit A